MIDHLVYITQNLEADRQWIESALGVSCSPGGRHLGRGTHNVLLRIGPATYLELLAADPQNKDIPQPRWMGVDLLPPTASGRLSRWAWAVTKAAIPDSADGRHIPFAPFEDGNRRLADDTQLTWKLTDPGTTPLIRATPFLIDWLGEPGPAERLPDHRLRLTHLRINGPTVTRLTSLRSPTTEIVYQPHATESITATIVNPDGDKVILR